MRIKIKIDGAEKEVELHPKKKHRDLFLIEAKKIQDKGEDLNSAINFLNFQDKLIIECSNLTEEEYNNLDLEEQNKLTIAMRNLLFPYLSEKKIIE